MLRNLKIIWASTKWSPLHLSCWAVEAKIQQFAQEYLHCRLR